MALAIFDLDNTLIGGDSDHAWGEFLCREGLVDADDYREANDRFYADYRKGTLDILAYQAFSLAPLVGRDADTLAAWHQRFMQTCIEPLLLPRAFDLLDEHRERGDTLLIITATNRFVTAPIAERLGVPHLLATEPEQKDGFYTGAVAGIPCFQRGKIERLDAWLDATGESAEDTYFYSDSRNDLPLLEQVDHPVAVDPDDTLRNMAEARGWPIISLR